MPVENIKPLILVVDDDQDLRVSLNDILEEEGYSVQTASNGRDAMEFLHAGARPAVILLDLMMREMNGYAVLKSLQSEPAFQSIPVLVLSASFKVKEQIGVRYLSKPFDFGELLESIGELIADGEGPQLRAAQG